MTDLYQIPVIITLSALLIFFVAMWYVKREKAIIYKRAYEGELQDHAKTKWELRCERDVIGGLSQAIDTINKDNAKSEWSPNNIVGKKAPSDD